jgi:hypothetical protein
MTRPSGYRRPQLHAWRPHEDDQLRRILSEGKGVAIAARLLTRSEKAVRARAAKLGIASIRIVRKSAHAN